MDPPPPWRGGHKRHWSVLALWDHSLWVELATPSGRQCIILQRGLCGEGCEGAIFTLAPGGPSADRQPLSSLTVTSGRP